MSKQSKQSNQPEFRSMNAYVHHYFPKTQLEPEDEQDIRAVAEKLAAGTVRSVRKQLAKR